MTGVEKKLFSKLFRRNDFDQNNSCAISHLTVIRSTGSTPAASTIFATLMVFAGGLLDQSAASWLYSATPAASIRLTFRLRAASRRFAHGRPMIGRMP